MYKTLNLGPRATGTALIGSRLCAFFPISMTKSVLIGLCQARYFYIIVMKSLVTFYFVSSRHDRHSSFDS